MMSRFTSAAQLYAMILVRTADCDFEIMS